MHLGHFSTSRPKLCFTTAAQLIDELSAASREGKLTSALATYMRPHVLVVDEVGHLAYGDERRTCSSA